MDPSPEALTGVLAATAIVFFWLKRSEAEKPQREANTLIEKMLYELEQGICPKCESIHPEATKHTGPNGFWTVFKCPECHYSMSAHVHHRDDD